MLKSFGSEAEKLMEHERMMLNLKRKKEEAEEGQAMASAAEVNDEP